MKKLLTALIVGFLLAFEVLRQMDIISFGILHVIARIWAVIPLVYGLRWIRNKESSKYKAGIVLLIFSMFMLIPNIVMLFIESQDHMLYIMVFGMLMFWPVITVLFLGSFFIGLLDRGETTYKVFFRNKVIDDPDWNLLDISLIAMFGKLTFILHPEDVTNRTMRLDITSVAGKVEVIIPQDVGVLSESKNRFGSFSIIDQKNRKLLGTEVIEQKIVEETSPRLLLITTSWLGNVTIKRAN